jgi:hypothetical protein
MNMHVNAPPPMSLKQVRLLDAADYIEKLPYKQWDMGQWCTCMAGHIEHRLTGRHSDDEHAGHVAGDWLLLTATEKWRLFMPSIFDLFPELMTGDSPGSLDGKDLSKVSRLWAARTMRHLAYTGKIDWAATRRAMPWSVARLAEVA